MFASLFLPGVGVPLPCTVLVGLPFCAKRGPHGSNREDIVQRVDWKGVYSQSDVAVTFKFLALEGKLSKMFFIDRKPKFRALHRPIRTRPNCLLLSKRPIKVPFICLRYYPKNIA